MKIDTLLAVPIIFLIGFNETLSFLPIDVEIKQLILRSLLTFAAYILVWLINIKVLLPKLAAAGRYAAYILIMFAMTLTCESLISIPYASSFTVFTGAALIFICMTGMSAPFLLKQWSDNTEKSVKAEQNLLDAQLSDRRLKIDSDSMFMALDRAAEQCETDKNEAVKTLYRLSDELRAQLYDNK